MATHYIVPNKADQRLKELICEEIGVPPEKTVELTFQSELFPGEGNRVRALVHGSLSEGRLYELQQIAIAQTQE